MRIDGRCPNVKGRIEKHTLSVYAINIYYDSIVG
jgi:hypothetical protein